MCISLSFEGQNSVTVSEMKTNKNFSQHDFINWNTSLQGQEWRGKTLKALCITSHHIGVLLTIDVQYFTKKTPSAEEDHEMHLNSRSSQKIDLKLLRCFFLKPQYQFCNMFSFFSHIDYILQNSLINKGMHKINCLIFVYRETRHHNFNPLRS